MTDRRLLAVLDTQVWIDIFLRQAILDPTQPYTAIFDAFLDDEFIPVYCRQTFDELHWMLSASRDVAQHYRIDPLDARDFVEAIFYQAGEFVAITGQVHVSSDPKDDLFVEAALTAKAAVLVAEDAHLHESAVHTLLGKNGIKLLYPKQFRKLLSERRT